MDKSGGSSTRLLAVALIIALLGVGFGGYEAVQPRTSGSVTVTSTIAGPTLTSTVSVTSATIVTVTEGSQQAKVSAITVGGATSNPQGMAFNPTNNELYVALENSSSVAVVNATTGALVTTIPLTAGDVPFALAYDSANNMVYVANLNGATCSPPAISTCTVPVINGATNTVATYIPMPDTTNGIVVNPSTNTVYAASNDDDAVFFINTTTNQVTELQIHSAVPDNSQALAIDTHTGVVIDGNWYHKRTASQIGLIGLDSNGGCITGTTTTNSTYCVTNRLGIDGGKIDSVAVNSNTGTIYVANPEKDVVNVISESTGKVVANVTVPSPVGVFADPFSNVVYVASNSTSSNALVVISGSTNSILADIPVGQGPANVAMDTNTNTIYVSNADSGTVSVIDGTSLFF